MELRTFRDSDVLAVQRLIHHTIDACYPKAYPPEAIAFFKRFHSVEAIAERARTGHIVVVERDGRVIATGALVDDEISGVFVDPVVQGAGMGSLVMDKLESIALICGCTATRLSVSLPSKGFYEHRGYRVLEECSIDVGSGECLAYWEAEKLLA